LIAPLLKGQAGVEEVLEIPSSRSKWIHELKSRHFDAALILQSQRKVTSGIWSAGIPLRVGPVSKLHTWFYLNQRVRQRRSQVEMHEALYNLKLLEPLQIKIDPLEEVAPKIRVQAEGQFLLKTWAESVGLSLQDSWVVVHPGMGGSAENWPERKYMELIDGLVRRGVKVVLSAGTHESGLARKVSGVHKLPIFGGEKLQPLVALAALFEQAKVVVAPSTGPLHLAAAVGTPVVSFYPTIQVQSAKRWGPKPLRPELARVIEAPVSCREKYKCKGRTCKEYPCMDKISVTSVQEAVFRYL